jgi:type II secretory pathway pseudopilin PulG
MIKKSERGFTTLELVIATAVTGLIIGALGTSIYQMLNVTGYGSGKMIALHELQNAAYWFQLDGQSASAATGGNALVLTLPDDTTVTYTLTDTELQRTADGDPMTLARNISGVNFSVSDRLLTMSLTSSPPGRGDISENETYRVYLRPTGGGT